MKSKTWGKAILVYPRFDGDNEDTFWSYKLTLKKYLPPNEFGLPKVMSPPLGLMGLYDFLKEYYDKIVLIDLNVEPRSLDEIIEGADPNHDHVYISAMSAQEQGFLKDAETVMDAGIPLIAGGPIIDEEFVKKLPLGTKKLFVVQNEAEMVMDDLMDDLASGRSGGYYKGTPPPPERFFQPDFSSINMANYTVMPIQTGRGCPFNCGFCSVTARFGAKPRYAPVEHAEEALRQLHERRWRGEVFFVDDNFIGNKRIAINILKSTHKLEQDMNHQFSKSAQLALDLADETPEAEELRRLFRENNFGMFFIGVETNNKDSLVEVRKKVNLRGKKSIAEKLKYISEETGAGVQLGMIHGFDHDTVESAKSLAEWINSTHSPIVMVGLLKALHKTDLLIQLEKEGRIKKEATGNNSDGQINFIPNNFSAKQAEKDYVEILKAIYSEEAFFGRVMRELTLFNRTVPKDRASLKYFFQEGAQSLFKVLTGENSKTYWKYLPKAHRIAREKFGFNISKYTYAMGLYVIRCAQYTHFKGQTKNLEEQVKQRHYEQWQLYSWKELQGSPVVSVVPLEPDKEEIYQPLYQTIRMRLKNGYEFVGTRLEALTHFAAPYLREGLQKLQTKMQELQAKTPSLTQLLDVEVGAYLKAHLKRPEILGNLDLLEVRDQVVNHLKETLQTQKENYLTKMSKLLKQVTS